MMHGQFSQYSVTGSQIWAHDPAYGMVMSGYENGGYYANEDWLISPALDLTQHTDIKFTLESAMNFGTASDGTLKVFYSTDYSGSGIQTQPHGLSFQAMLYQQEDGHGLLPEILICQIL